LGFAGYLLLAIGPERLVVALALAAVFALMPIVLSGIRSSNRINGLMSVVECFEKVCGVIERRLGVIWVGC
jgi:hypothetical protein